MHLDRLITKPKLN